jgi:hypothetical protein
LFPLATEKKQRLMSAIILEAFYCYGYKGRDMIAVRAPFAMSARADEMIGREVEVAGRRYVALGVARQISGPIAKGEPIGIEVREASQ